jgi:epoxyqueuosine reductase
MNNMTIQSEINMIEKVNAKKIGDFIGQYAIDLYGIANLNEFNSTSNSSHTLSDQVIKNYKYAIVIGSKLRNKGEIVNGTDTALFLEEVAFKLMLHIIEKEKHSALIIHTEDEFDPVNRKGIMSLKALAKCAGLGWQGRSLLIISPKYGPLHRIIAILTDMPLIANRSILNQCGECYLCIEKCPTNALKIATLFDHPENREDILDILKCKGDQGCKICINVCPWIKEKDTIN